MLCHAWITGCTCFSGVTQRGLGQKLPLTGDRRHLKLIVVQKYLFRFRFQWAILASRSIHMMTSSNGNIFRVTGPLCGEVTGHRWIPLTKASDAGFDVFYDRRLNKRLSTQPWGWLFETPSCSLWRHPNGFLLFTRRRWWMMDYCVTWEYILSSRTGVEPEEEMTPSTMSV